MLHKLYKVRRSIVHQHVVHSLVRTLPLARLAFFQLAHHAVHVNHNLSRGADGEPRRGHGFCPDSMKLRLAEAILNPTSIPSLFADQDPRLVQERMDCQPFVLHDRERITLEHHVRNVGDLHIAIQLLGFYPRQVSVEVPIAQIRRLKPAPRKRQLGLLHHGKVNTIKSWHCVIIDGRHIRSTVHKDDHVTLHVEPAQGNKKKQQTITQDVGGHAQHEPVGRARKQRNLSKAIHSPRIIDRTRL
mmetsp:Transcript_61430/g.163471  ORF Transcript_61430/g.163471 Transcript_61430/m.163471 type:complete len:244 (+) Transcript_61430:736-1467(+)